MLLRTLHVGDGAAIGDCTVEVVRIRGGQVRLGFRGPRIFLREELRGQAAQPVIGKGLLVLGRKPGERIWIDDLGTVTVIWISDRRARLGYDFPSSMPIRHFKGSPR